MRRRLLFTLGLALLALLALAAGPLAAQEAATPAPGSTVAVMGPVTLSDDEIRVNGYLIAPAGAFRASILDEGDVVMITGVLLPDGMTVQADRIEFYDEADAVNEDRGRDDEDEDEDEDEQDEDDEREDDEEADAADCARDDHPVGLQLAAAFDVPYAEIMGWRCERFGFGEIMRAYALAGATGEPVEAYFALKAAGVGWGEIMREAEDALEDVPVPIVIPGRPLEFCAGNSCNAPGRPDCPGNSCNAPGQNK